LNVNNLQNQFIQSRYFSPHSSKTFNGKLSNKEVQPSFSQFLHNNRAEMESQKLKLQSKMTVHHLQAFQAVFEYVPTPLASGGVGLFVDESLDFRVLENASSEAFQALWIEISFIKNKNILCGIIYRQENSLECFQSYLK